PMVGTCYLRPSPDAELFAAIGDHVKEGETIMLVEAMKTFNPITAPKSGTLSAVYVEDVAPVEFGDSLFLID
ncbi:MAG: biotin/lipoyl-containing protein, partial [Litorimonas sp.]